MDFTKLKLIVWDLDDTFWQGTLTEGNISILPENITRVIDLCYQGVMSSICSNNNLSEVQYILEKEAVWSFFIFPMINWGVKSSMIIDLLQATQLRPENVIFVDDKARIRAEVIQNVPNLLGVLSPEELTSEYNSWKAKFISPDKTLKRLNDYKLLEKKFAEKIARRVEESDEQFLINSQIECYLYPPSLDDLDRILELVLRTNQLNFTKKRIDQEELVNLIRSDKHLVRIAEVKDRFGNYGICGFIVCSATQLEHFLFSCRILNMGIEQAIYQYLVKYTIPPTTQPEFEVLKNNAIVSWVQLYWSRTCYQAPKTEPRPCALPLKLALCGECNLLSFTDMCATNFEKAGVVKTHQRFYTNYQGKHLVFFPHSTVLNTWLKGDTEIRQHINSLVPWLPEIIFPAEKPVSDVAILSLGQDYYSALYQHKTLGFKIPYLYYHIGCGDLTQKSTQNLALERHNNVGLTPENIAEFARHFKFLGPMTPEQQKSNLEELLTLLPPATHLVVINAAEIITWTKLQHTGNYVSLEHLIAQGHHFALLNQAVDGFVARHTDRVTLIDIRKHVQKPVDAEDNLHFHKKHREIFAEILAQLRRLNKIRSADVYSIEQVDEVLKSYL